MTQIVNLRTARKKKARAERENVAAENRVKFGTSKAKRLLNEEETALASRRLDGHKLDKESEE